LAVACLASSAWAGGFYAETDGLGYAGTIWNVTQQQGPWSTNGPRDAALYLNSNIGGAYSNYNQLLSSWWEHNPSNQNDSFLQLDDPGNATVLFASGSWDPTLTQFTVTVIGEDAPYPYSRMWQPDNGVAWGVAFTSYMYSFTATFPTAAVVEDGWLVNSSDASNVVGRFQGMFTVTDDVNKLPITNGDQYRFDIGFSSDLFDARVNGVDSTAGLITPYYYFGSEVPEPLTMLGVFAGVTGIGAYLRRRRAA